MALTLIKEDGTGVAGSNSYASAADGDAYHDGHLYATDWTGATQAQKEQALVMATRLIDALYQFHGFKVNSGQSRQWPRKKCPAPDVEGASLLGLADWSRPFIGEGTIPQELVDAVCETARALILEDRTQNPVGEGLAEARVDTVWTKFDASDRAKILPLVARKMLCKLGTYLESPIGTAKLSRC